MMFSLWKSGGRKEPRMVLESRSPHVKGQYFEGEKGAGPGQDQTCPTVDVPTARHQGAEPV